MVLYCFIVFLFIGIVGKEFLIVVWCGGILGVLFLLFLIFLVKVGKLNLLFLLLFFFSLVIFFCFVGVVCCVVFLGFLLEFLDLVVSGDWFVLDLDCCIK